MRAIIGTWKMSFAGVSEALDMEAVRKIMGV